MVSLTPKEKESLLILFKDFTTFYNANSISKVLGISHVGAQKVFKRLLKENLLLSKQIGKSIVYKPKLNDDYVRKLISFLLADEANNFKRWKEEFKALFKEGRIIMLYGSAVKNYEKASDIDLMIVLKKEALKEVKNILKEKEELLPKKIHSIELTADDLLKNIKKKEEATLNIIKNSVILYGQDDYVEMIKDVTSL
ncbi:nucleotidyltransferase domain-containing protein [Candidatus Woesearchaeota archaeon]|nr:nucleotidyltransferase domain-containing protein [Candidatus Woesearchaeota archaeon]